MMDYLEIAETTLNESTMHDAKLDREVKKMLLGEEDKVQWGEILRTFCQLQKGRMEIALESLTKRQLDMLIDSAQTVKEDVQQSTLEAAKTELLRLGLTPEEFIAFISGVPAAAATTDDKVITKSGRVNYKLTYGKTRSEIIDEIVEVGELTPPISSVQMKIVIKKHRLPYADLSESIWYSAAYEYNTKHGVSLTK